MNRMKVLEERAKLKSARKAFLSRLETARIELSPKSLVSKWKNKQADKIWIVISNTKQAIINNKLFLGSLGACAVLFTIRKPISKLIHNLRQRRAN